MTDTLGVMQLFETIIEWKEMVFCNCVRMESASFKTGLNTVFSFDFYFISHINLAFVPGKRTIDFMPGLMINNIDEAELLSVIVKQMF